MRKFFQILMIVTAASAAVLSCTVAEGENLRGTASEVVITLSSPQTRAVFTEPSGDSYPVVWQRGDEVKLLVNSSEINASSDKGVYKLALSEDGSKAVFGASFTAPSESWDLACMSPATAFVGTAQNGFSYRINTNQASGALSADPAAMVLSSTAGPFSEIPRTVDLSFRHVTAYLRLSFEGLSGDLSSVRLESEKSIAGIARFNHGTHASSVVSGSRKVTVSAAEGSDAVWIACLPCDLSDTEMKISVSTSKGTFTRDLLLPSGRVLEAGKIARLRIDMGEAQLKSPDFDEDNIAVSFGAISDTHINGTATMPAEKLVKALNQLKTLAAVKDADGIDAVVVAGDLTDTPSQTQSQTGYFKVLYERVFDPVSVPMLYTVGNHDANPSYWWTSNTILQARVMSQALGDKYFQTDQSDGMREDYECRHNVVGGVHFLSITPTGTYPVTYPQASKDWLDSMLAKLTADNPESFIFVNTHPMIEGTTYGSLLGTPAGMAKSDIWTSNDSWATRDLTDILKKYPQVVTFGGHLHFPLNDPRSVWQGDFTSFGTASVRYMAIENGKYEDMKSATVMNDNEAFSQGWLIQIDVNGNLRATPVDFYRSRVIGSPYEIPYPNTSKSHLQKYGSARIEANAAPDMTEDNIRLVEGDKLEWDAASDDEFVHHYTVKIRKDGLTYVNKKFLADFYLHPLPSEMKDKWSVSLEGLNDGDYTAEITAVDSWDASVSCTKKISVTGHQAPEPGLYADIDFSGGAITDSRGKLDITNMGGVVSDVSVSHAGKSSTVPALQAGSSKYVVCQFSGIGSTGAMLTFMSGGFSVEAMFVDRAPGSAIHGVVCGTQYGGWGLAVKDTGVPYFIVGENSYNSYKSVSAKSAISKTELSHVVCVYDVAGKKIHIYVNGSLSASTDISGSYYNGAGTAFNRFCLGADISESSAPDFPCTDMVITDVKFYTGALDADAVHAAYEAALP